MITAGVKFTQSGGIALVDGDDLVFHIEMQKLANNSRYSDFDDLRLIPGLVREYGYEVSDVDHWVVDGWDGARKGRIDVHTEEGLTEILVAPYRETELVPNPGRPGHSAEILIDGKLRPYSSYVHVASHLSAAYSTSPFAQRGEPSMVLVWDGGCFPRLYSVDGDGRIEPGGEAFPLIGHTYAMAAQYYGPWKRADGMSTHVDDLGVAGKMMAYIGLGKPSQAVKDVLAETFHEHFLADTPYVRDYRANIIGCGSTGEPSHFYVHAFLRKVQQRVAGLGVSDEDVLATVHVFLEETLINGVTKKILEWKGGPQNLCFAGGCALNIKWNSALRAHPAIREMWVPPFPDDSGSSIGTACAHLGSGDGLRYLNWNAFQGPKLVPTEKAPTGWTTSACTTTELGRLLHTSGEPVVVLNGRAELGPRALGARSILAAPVSPEMKTKLNDVKNREYYRPVAPICLVEHAPEIFDPGTPDPYMLFEHWVRPSWTDRIPAVLHLDGTARLQTVSDNDAPGLAEILRGYHEASGVPVLCNTSANLNGHGFFPDVTSAMEWGHVDMIWSEGTLYRQVH